MVGTGDGELLEAELAVVCGALNQVSARLVDVTARAIASEGWAGAGIRSVEHWLVLRAGLSPGRARQVVAMARRAAVLPVVMGQFAAGRLSVDQVAVVARHAPAHVEASVAELAVLASVPQLGRVLSRYSFDPATEAGPDEPPDADAAGAAEGADAVAAAAWGAVEPPLDEVGRAGESAQLSMRSGEGGRFELRFSAPADVGALVEAALSEAKDALFAAGSPEVSWADALVEVCSRSVASVTTRSRQESFRVYVHLDAEGGWLNGRARLPGHLVAKLTCAGTVQPLWHAAGVPVSVGRALRIVPERTRRLVLDRDRGCRFPGCVARGHLEVHHVLHWADGGGTDLENLAALCPFHHDGHHRGDFTVTVDANRPDGLVFATAGGFSIRPGPKYTPTPLPSGPRVCTIGIPITSADGRGGPKGPGKLDPGGELNDLRDLAYPDEDDGPGEGDEHDERADPGKGDRDERERDAPSRDEQALWPGMAPPVAYPGASGEVLHGKWVTFHEGPALLP